MKELRSPQSEGLIPARDYRALVQAVKELNKMSVGEGLTLYRNPNGLHIALNRRPELPITFSVEGPLIVGANAAKKLRVETARTIVAVGFYIETTSASGSVIVDVNISDTPDGAATTLYSVATKPTITATNYEDLTSLPDTKVIDAGKYVSIDIDSSGTGARDLTLILYER